MYKKKEDGEKKLKKGERKRETGKKKRNGKEKEKRESKRVKSMQNREELRPKAMIGVEKQGVARGGKYHFQRRRVQYILFSDRNIDPCTDALCCFQNRILEC